MLIHETMINGKRDMAWGIAKPSNTGTVWATPPPISKTAPLVLPEA